MDYASLGNRHTNGSLRDKLKANCNRRVRGHAGYSEIGRLRTVSCCVLYLKEKRGPIHLRPLEYKARSDPWKDRRTQPTQRDALTPLSRLRFKPKNFTTWLRRSTPQYPLFLPFASVHSNQGSPKAPDSKAWRVFEARSSSTLGWFICVWMSVSEACQRRCRDQRVTHRR